jgi:antitoxin component YwqK of YwqJK toxin-antitoxin module
MLFKLFLNSNPASSLYLCGKVLQLKKMKLFLTILWIVLGFGYIQGQDVELVNGKYLKDGKIYTGVLREYNQNGTLIAEKNIKKGMPDGISLLYYDNGNKKEQQAYKKGQKEGTWMNWDIAGIKTAEAGYLKNLKHGYWYIWDENGNLRYEMYYEKGHKSGVWKMWDEKGQLVDEKKY